MSDELEGKIHLIGMAILFSLMIFITLKDFNMFILKNNFCRNSAPEQKELRFRGKTKAKVQTLLRGGVLCVSGKRKKL